MRRTILELIADELLKMAPQQLSPDPSGSYLHGGSLQGGQAMRHLAEHAAANGDNAGSQSPAESPHLQDGSAHGGMFFPMSPDAGGTGMQRESSANMLSGSFDRSLQGSFFRVGCLCASDENACAHPSTTSMQSALGLTFEIYGFCSRAAAAAALWVCPRWPWHGALAVHASYGGAGAGGHS